MKPSEYGGSDTHKTHGIQPEPHILTADEKLRLMYKQDPDEVEATIPAGLPPDALNG